MRNFLVANALYWLEEFHIDGLRVDAVASMLYLDYSREGRRVDAEHARRPGEPRGGGVPAGDERHRLPARPRRRRRSPRSRPPGRGVTRPTHLGGLGFGLKWNMGWMHDSLDYMAHEPIHRSTTTTEMTFSMVYAYCENYVLPISHDEVVHGKGSLLRKMPGDRWQQLANLRAYLAFMWAHPGKQLLFMGSEFAPGGGVVGGARARLVAARLRRAHRGVQRLVRDLNAVYRDDARAVAAGPRPGGFRWIDANDAARQRVLVPAHATPTARRWPCVANFSAGPARRLPARAARTPAAGARCSTPTPRATPAVGVGNLGAVDADRRALARAARVRGRAVPPLATVWLRSPGA